MVSTLPPTSKFSSPFNNPLVTVPKAPIRIGIIVSFMFYSFFNSLARSRYLSFFSHSLSFILWSARTAKSTIWQIIIIILIVVVASLILLYHYCYYYCCCYCFCCCIISALLFCCYCYCCVIIVIVALLFFFVAVLSLLLCHY